MIRQDFAEGLRIQGRVVLALMLREARTRYGRMRAGYLWALVEPVIHISMFSVIYHSMVAPLGNSTILFLATGFLTFLGFRNVMGRTEGAYGSNEALLSFPVVRVMDVYLARGLLELATWALVTFLLIGGLILFGVAPLPHDVPKLLEAVLALFAIGFGAGIVISILSEFWPTLQTVMGVVSRVLYFTSAIFYLPDGMPLAFRKILAWNPVVHGVTLFREGYYRGYESHLLDTGYLWIWAVGCILCGLVAEKVARKPLRSLAT